MDSEDIPIPLSLLLLPPQPSPPSSSALKAAYAQPLAYVLRSVAKLPTHSSNASILDIALPCVFSSTQDRSVRSSIYDAVQKLVARLYRLVSIICAQQSIEVEGPGGVNVRVFLFEYSQELQFDGTEQPSSLRSSPSGPLIDLPTLAGCDRDWMRVYSFGCEGGEVLLRYFKNLRAQVVPKAENLDIVIVLGDTEMDQASNSEPSVSQTPKRSEIKHESVAVGGTFDHLHAGHKLLLTMTAFVLEPSSDSSRNRSFVNTRNKTLTVGITGDELLQNKRFAEYMQSWGDRLDGVLNFLTGILDFSPPDKASKVWRRRVPSTSGELFEVTLLHPHMKIRCVEISDPFGPTITDESISALVISAETRGGGTAVNEKRREKGWAELEVFEVDVLDAVEEGDVDSGAVKEDFASKISSTEIRRRKCDMAQTGVERSSKRQRTKQQG